MAAKKRMTNLTFSVHSGFETAFHAEGRGEMEDAEKVTTFFSPRPPRPPREAGRRNWLFVDLAAGEAQGCHSEGGAALNPTFILHSAPTEESPLRTARRFVEARTVCVRMFSGENRQRSSRGWIPRSAHGICCVGTRSRGALLGMTSLWAAAGYSRMHCNPIRDESGNLSARRTVRNGRVDRRGLAIGERPRSRNSVDFVQRKWKSASGGPETLLHGGRTGSIRIALC
jgi:hypothetical protein